jgi:flagellin
MAALALQRSLGASSAEERRSIARLSSGLRVAGAADDPAAMAISGRMTTQVRGLAAAIRNIGDTLSMLQVADAGASSIQAQLQRVRELALRAANGALDGAQRAALDEEAGLLVDDMARTATATAFNGTPLLTGALKSSSVSIGEGPSDVMSLSPIPDLRPSALGTGGDLALRGTALNRTNTYGNSSVGAHGGLVISTWNGDSAPIGWSAGARLETIAQAIRSAVPASMGLTVTATNGATLGGLTSAGSLTLSVNNRAVTANVTPTDLSALAAQINALVTPTTGISASVDPGSPGMLRMTAADGRDILVTGFQRTGDAFAPVAARVGSFDPVTGAAGNSVAVSSVNTAVLGNFSTAATLQFSLQGAAAATITAAVDPADLSALVSAINAREGSTRIRAALGPGSSTSSVVLTRSDGGNIGITQLGSPSGDTVTGRLYDVDPITGAQALAGNLTTVPPPPTTWSSTLRTAALSNFNTAGTLSFTLTGSGSATVTAAIVPGNLSALVGAINGQAAVTGITAALGPGARTDALTLTRASGTIRITNFTTPGAVALTGRLSDRNPVTDVLTTRGNLTTVPPVSTWSAGGNPDASRSIGLLRLTAEEGPVSWANATGATVFGSVGGRTASVGEISLATQDAAIQALEMIDVGLEQLSAARATLGASMSRLEAVIDIQRVTADATQAARGRLVDADMSRESAALARAQIVRDAATAMLALANAEPQLLISLLDGLDVPGEPDGSEA